MAIDLAKTIDQETRGTTVGVHNRAGRSNIVLVCEHATYLIPPEFNHLGLSPDLRQSHIAWDPGALGVAEALSKLLDAPLVAQNVSRLLYDCNRPPEAADAVPEISEVHAIPGNRDLTGRQRAERAERFYAPFGKTLAAVLDERARNNALPVLVTIHSFTPVFKGVRRAVEVGILHDTDARLADAVLAAATEAEFTEAEFSEAEFSIARNQPYGPADGVMHTLKVHGQSRGLLNVMIEIRNDLVCDEKHQGQMAAWLAAVLERALKEEKGAMV